MWFEREWVRPPKGVKDRFGEVRAPIARATGCLQDLLTVNPALRELPSMVQPHRHRTTAGPRDPGRHRRRILDAHQLDDLIVCPGEKIGHESRAKSSSGVDPLDLELVEPADESSLTQSSGRRSSAMTVALPREQAEIVTQ